MTSRAGRRRSNEQLDDIASPSGSPQTHHPRVARLSTVLSDERQVMGYFFT
jgi:hypothetical protein